MSDTEMNGMNGAAHTTPSTVEVDYLIVGTGPAGGALAAFMASYGMKGLIVNRDPSNANTPRAHITNMAALDCLRDFGLDTQCYQLGTGNDSMRHTRWSATMAGKEYGRIYSWGNDPRRKGDYELASPSRMLDLPQTLLEPVLIRHATLNGFKCRWDTEFISFTQDAEGVTTTLLDKVTGQTYNVRSRYLFGADGGRSEIVRQASIPLIRCPGQGWAVNVRIKADLSHLIEPRMGNLHWVIQPHLETPDWAWIGCFRMVKPWYEWMAIIFTAPTAERKVRSNEEYLVRIKELLGDDSVDIEILDVSTWAINETTAEYYSAGNVFCLGDAVHRHPPNHGLGSNTCIQDAHNLAWKINYVDKGLAGRKLLDSYSIERQPVGLHVVTQANASLRNHKNIWTVLGNLEPTLEARKAALAEIDAETPAGAKRRAELTKALRAIDREEHGLGIEMNQRYRSDAVYQADQGPAPAFKRDPLEHYHPTTYPGARLPHAWLGEHVPSKYISTIDLAGNGQFTLFTGIGGSGWKGAVETLAKELRIPFKAYSVGYAQDYKDVYMDWEAQREVGESGCVVVRPDYFVAWRCQAWEDDGIERLRKVMRSVLALD